MATRRCFVDRSNVDSSKVLPTGALFYRQSHSWRPLRQLGRPEKLVWAAGGLSGTARGAGLSGLGASGRPGRPGKPVWAAWDACLSGLEACLGGLGACLGGLGGQGLGGLGNLSGQPRRPGKPVWAAWAAFWASWEPGKAESA